MGDIGGEIGDGDRVSETLKVHFNPRLEMYGWKVAEKVVKWMNFPSSLPSSETDVIGESDSRDTLRVVSCTSKLVAVGSISDGIGRLGRDWLELRGGFGGKSA